MQLGILSCAGELKVILLSSEVATLGLVCVRIQLFLCISRQAGTPLFVLSRQTDSDILYFLFLLVVTRQ